VDAAAVVASSLMRVAVYNRHWPTAGGGERFAGGIAEVLSEQHDVTLVAHEPFDVEELAERLQLDLSRVRVDVVGPSPEAVTGASGSVELFVNASYASDDLSAAPRSMYVVHFPALPPFNPGRGRRLAISAAARLADLARVERLPARVVDGVYMAESVAGLPVRWTNGEACLEVPGGRPVTLLLGRFHPPAAGELLVEATVDGEVVASTSVAPRTSRVQPPVRVLQVPRLAAGQHRLQVRSRRWRPGDHGSADGRELGVALVAVLAGGGWQRALQGLFQVIAVPTTTGAFLDSYDLVMSNSRFTRGWVQRLWGRDSEVLYPPVVAQPRGSKEQVILGVGRFFDPGAGHNKRQLELVQAFRQLGAAGWSLHLVGGCDRLGEAYLAEVREAARGLDVELHVNASGAQVRELYGRASLFWHATGLGEDEEAHPERFEHFGITTVEAMSAGVVPVVIAKAGQLELFEPDKAGLLWTTIDELVEHSGRLIAEPERRAAMADAAVAEAQRFLRPAFAARLNQLVGTLC
jgi:glycosyltransferase involved in cell wall biosynthesis